MPEAVLARELKLSYAMIAHSVNWAAGVTEEELDMEKINQIAQEGMGFASQIISEFIDLNF